MATLLTYALTSLADVKESMGIAASDTSYDNLIVRKINQVTRQIEGYCGRRFLDTSYTNEEYDSTNTSQLILRQRPITATTALALSVRDSGLNSDSWTVVDTELYFADAPSGVIDLNFGAYGSWNRWRVTYSAGYTTIPEDLAEAAATLAAYYVDNSDGSNIGVTQKKEGARQINYAGAGLSFEELIKNLGINGILDTYANYPLLAGR